VTAPRNLVATYVPGRSREQVEGQALALSRVSAFEPVGHLASGWLLALEPAPAAAQHHSNRPELATIETNGSLTMLATEDGRAARQGQPEALRRLPGEFAFCSLGEGGSLVAVRSCGGLVPLYYYVVDGVLCVATRLRDLYWLCPQELVPDPLVHAIWSAGNAFFPDGRSLFRGVRCLPKGHVLRVHKRSIRIEPYWDPRPRELPEPARAVQEEHARVLRQTLLASLDEGLSRTGGNLLTLSGGVDSSSIAVLGRRTLERPLATLTFVAPTSSKARHRQLSFVSPLLDELAIDRRFLVDAEDAFLDDLFATPLATLCYCPHPALRLMPRLSGNFTTLVSGHFADELCGYSQRLQDWVRHTSLRALLTPRWPPTYGLRDCLRWGKRRALERLNRALLPLPRPLSTLISPDLREEMDEWGARTRARMLADPRPLRELAAWVELDGWIAMHWEVASVLGARPLHPFFSRAALELGFACHPLELFGPGPKKLLRRALHGTVPDRYLQRRDKGHWHRPPRRDLAGWHGQLSLLSACVAAPVELGRARLSHVDRRQLTQLSLFEAALKREGQIRASLFIGSS
jgi:hypothetical protein